MPETPVPPPRWHIRWRGFGDAARGCALLLRTQPNARIHLAATVGAVAGGVWLGLSPGEWAALILAIALVWVTEALNTAVEFTVDLVSPEHRQLAGWAKDAAAGAVLLASVAAVGVGLALFGPKLWHH
jgi:diacylglycerol kinase (ATP)